MAKFVCVLFLFSAPFLGFTQVYKGKIGPPSPSKSDTYTPADTLPKDTLSKKQSAADSTLKDTSAQALSDSTLGDSSLVKKNGDTLSVQAKNQKHDIETTIKYTAEDSITMDMATKMAYLYKDAKIDYGSYTLDAERVDIDWAHSLVTAKGVPDSSGTKLIGTPVFHEKSQLYTAEVIKFNFKTKKGIISKIVTKQGQGFVHGEKVKRNAEGEMFLNTAKYTTCDLPHPHFYIEATKLKMIPGKKIVSGPFIMKVADVPTPLGFFLGYFPMPQRKKSGIIFPTIGEQAARGFYISQGGYYWAPNDYMGIKMVGDIYSNGSYKVNVIDTYKKKYRYAGSLNVAYGKLYPNYEHTDGTALFNIIWSHNSVAKRGRTFTANVNITSNKNYSISSYNPTAVMSNVFSSTIGYNKTFAGTPFNISINARQDENVRTKTMNLTLPQVSFNMNRVFPFKRKINSTGAWYEKISIGYSGNGQFSTTTLPVNLVAPTGENVVAPLTTRDTLNPNPFTHPIKNIIQGFADRGQLGAKQSIPISSTFSLLKVFNLSPSLVYDEYWYTKKNLYNYRDTSLYVTSQHGFFRAYDFSVSAPLTTNIYGTLNFKSKTLKAIRHTLRPNIAWAWHPDFKNPAYGYYAAKTQTSRTGSEQSFPYYTQSFPGGPPIGAMNGINFSLTNTLEAKVRSSKDTGNPIKKISLLNNVGLSGNYNFAAQHFKLSTLAVIATTTLFGRINVNYNSILDPYYYVPTYNSTGGLISQIRVDSFAFSHGKGLFKVASTTVSLSGNVNPKGQKAASTGPPIAPVVPQSSVNYANPNLYVDFNIPWNLFLSFNFNSSKQGYAAASVTKSITLNGDIRISDKWKITVSSGYSITQKSITMTTVSINRDLHCWQMSFYVIPFGLSQTYTFTLVAKSSLLQDLKLNKRSPGYIGQPY